MIIWQDIPLASCAFVRIGHAGLIDQQANVAFIVMKTRDGDEGSAASREGCAAKEGKIQRCNKLDFHVQKHPKVND